MAGAVLSEVGVLVGVEEGVCSLLSSGELVRGPGGSSASSSRPASLSAAHGLGVLTITG